MSYYQQSIRNDAHDRANNFFKSKVNSLNITVDKFADNYIEILKTHTLLILDTETTGLRKDDKLWQISIRVLQNYKEIDHLYETFKPANEPEVRTRDEYDPQFARYKSILDMDTIPLQKINDFLAKYNNSVIIAHNISFDVPHCDRVEVKTDAYEIQIAKAQKDAEGKEVLYIKKEANKQDVTCNFAKDIKAATNAGASNKKVTYYLVDADGKASAATTVKLKADDRKTVKIVAADTREHGEETVGAVERSIDLVCVTDEKIAANYTVEIENKEELAPLKVFKILLAVTIIIMIAVPLIVIFAFWWKTTI